MRTMLGRVVESDAGTGRRARMTDYTAGGKTGTTEKFDVEQGAYSDETMASFIGMAPLDDPRIVVAVVLDSPYGELEDGTDLSLGGAWRRGARDGSPRGFRARQGRIGGPGVRRGDPGCAASTGRCTRPEVNRVGPTVGGRRSNARRRVAER